MRCALLDLAILFCAPSVVFVNFSVYSYNSPVSPVVIGLRDGYWLSMYCNLRNIQSLTAILFSRMSPDSKDILKN